MIILRPRSQEIINENVAKWQFADGGSATKRIDYHCDDNVEVDLADEQMEQVEENDRTKIVATALWTLPVLGISAILDDGLVGLLWIALVQYVTLPRGLKHD